MDGAGLTSLPMERTITFEFTGGDEVDAVDMKDFATDVARFMAEQIGFDTATVTIHGRRGRGGWKTEVVEALP